MLIGEWPDCDTRDADTTTLREKVEGKSTNHHAEDTGALCVCVHLLDEWDEVALDVHDQQHGDKLFGSQLQHEREDGEQSVQ